MPYVYPFDMHIEPKMTDRIPYKGRSLDFFPSGDGWMVEIIDSHGRRSITKARALERAINAAYQKIDEEEAVIASRISQLTCK